jgi:hypothetical protein
MFRIRPPLPRLASRLSVADRPWTQSRCASVGRPVGSKDHWTPEKLATRDEYPLTVALSQVMHPSMATKKTRRNSSSPTGSSKTHSAVHVRTQIVSPGLCGMWFPARLPDADTALTSARRRCPEAHWTYAGAAQGLRHPRYQPRRMSLVPEAARLPPTAQSRPPRAESRVLPELPRPASQCARVHIQAGREGSSRSADL